MASFDLKTFLSVKGETGTGTLEAIGMSYGLPSCMLDLTRDVLQLLPSDILQGSQSSFGSGKKKADEVTAEIFKKLSLNTGIIEFDTEEGRIRFKSISSLSGGDEDESKGLSDLGKFLDAIDYAADFGAQLYANYQDIENQIQDIQACFDKYKEVRDFQSGNSANQSATLSQAEQDALINAQYGADLQKLAVSQDFSNRCASSIEIINSILDERASDPSKEPTFVDTAEIRNILSGTPYKIVAADDPELESEEDIFRLVFGPPITSEGQFVLTSDGLYYDARSGGLDPVYAAISGTVAAGDLWKYEYDPNLGGKGDAISLDSLDKFADNLFDPARIDDSTAMELYYEADHFLAVLRQQRDKHIYDLSGELTDMINDYGTDSSITQNQRSIIAAQIANHNHKINRRKKQLEVAVKAPQLYGNTDKPLFAPGEIPINDFAYLGDYNIVVDLEKQKALVFEQAEVDGIVLPINPKFVKAPPKPRSISYEHLNVPTVGKGGIIYTPSASPSGTVLSLTDQIVSDKLFAIYNFLESEVVTPSSVDFKVTNCATPDQYNNAKLVAANRSNVFFSGLSIPYLEGIVKNKSNEPAAASSLGSFVRLPDTPEYRDLTYGVSGFTMECWVHVPDIRDGEVGWLSGTTSSLTKVLLGCENVGSSSGTSALDGDGNPLDLDYLPNKGGNDYNRGMLIGFSRDRRITQDASAFSNNNFDNDPVSSLSFFVAPTQSRDFSSLNFINSDSQNCYESPKFHKMKVDLSAQQDLSSVDSKFVLVDVVFDPLKDKLSMYADGRLMATSSLSQTFATEPHIPPNLPNFKKDNSFEYNSSSVDGPITLHSGPKLNPFYTPWIVGGGYTDGMYEHGNFMGGGARGGVISGLRGHIGSLKFYSKPLNSVEVKKNYDAQQG